MNKEGFGIGYKMAAGDCADSFFCNLRLAV
jgi:hypothetical protein